MYATLKLAVTLPPQNKKKNCQKLPSYGSVPTDYKNNSS